MDPVYIYTYLMYAILALALKELVQLAREAKDRFKKKMTDIN